MKIAAILTLLGVAFICTVSARSKVDWSKVKKAVPGTVKKNHHKHKAAFLKEQKNRLPEDRVGNLPQMKDLTNGLEMHQGKFATPNLDGQKKMSPQMTNKYTKKVNSPIEKQKLEIKTKPRPGHKKKDAMNPNKKHVKRDQMKAQEKLDMKRQKNRKMMQAKNIADGKKQHGFHKIRTQH